MLTDKQGVFVREYLIDLNATQAAIRAGYSLRTAKQIGHENLSKPDVAAAIADAQRERMARLEITADRVLQEIARIAFFNIRECFDERGNLLSIHRLSDDAAAAIASVEVITRGSHGSCPRCQRAERLAAYLGARLWQILQALDRAGITGEVGQPTSSQEFNLAEEPDSRRPTCP